MARDRLPRPMVRHNQFALKRLLGLGLYLLYFTLPWGWQCLLDPLSNHVLSCPALFLRRRWTYRRRLYAIALCEHPHFLPQQNN